MSRRSRRTLLSCIATSLLIVNASSAILADIDDATIAQVRANMLQIASAR